MDEDFLDVLLDATTETRLKLLTEDEARAIMMLLGALEDEARSGEVRQAAGEMRCRLGARLAIPIGAHSPVSVSR
ncbi:hypothetical protein [Streptomyces sp. NPDC048340]|uniref:hypothetical protein n=1 Tax=Streptomyces sp. NPDC048340 TaxID=3365537 RepID=UPI00372058C8